MIFTNDCIISQWWVSGLIAIWSTTIRYIATYTYRNIRCYFNITKLYTLKLKLSRNKWNRWPKSSKLQNFKIGHGKVGHAYQNICCVLVLGEFYRRGKQFWSTTARLGKGFTEIKKRKSCQIFRITWAHHFTLVSCSKLYTVLCY